MFPLFRVFDFSTSIQIYIWDDFSRKSLVGVLRALDQLLHSSIHSELLEEGCARQFVSRLETTVREVFDVT